MRNFKIISSIYIFAFLFISGSGLLIDSSAETTDFALKYFTKSELVTGELRLYYGLIPSIIGSLLSTLVIFFLILKGYDIKIYRKLESRIKLKFLLLALSFFIIFWLVSLIKLPFTVFSSYYGGKVFNMINIDFSLWIMRYFLNLFINSILFSSGLSLLAIIILKIKRYILFLPLAFITCAMAYTIIYPEVIIPSFYDSVRIENQQLEDSIKDLSKKSGVNIAHISVINKSKYSSYINAMFVGFGNNKRIILYDTLLKKLKDDEIISIVAHEMGHYVENHVLAGTLMGSIGIVILIVFLSGFLKFLFGLNLKESLKRGWVLRVYFIFMIIMFFSNPVEKTISRYIEKRADIYALKLTSNGKSFINMKVNSSRLNKSNLRPNKFFKWFYYTHPDTLIRIKMAESFMKE